MRIVGGASRGRRLTPLGKGAPADHLRPTSDRVRESLFNVIEHGRHGRDLTGAHVLDLFAGSGALGFEALSRGAAHVTFVENGRAAQRLIRDNAALLDAGVQMTLLPLDAARLGPCEGDPCALVFLDPPYGNGLGAPALDAARAGGWLAPDALVVWEEATEMPAPDGFAVLDARRYGDTHITFLEVSP